MIEKYSKSAFIEQFPNLVVTVAWIHPTPNAPINLGNHAPYSLHAIVTNQPGLTLLDAEGLRLAQTNAQLSPYLAFRSFVFDAESLPQTLEGDISRAVTIPDVFNMIVKGLSIDQIKEIVSNDDFKCFMLAAFFNGMPSVGSYNNIRKTIELVSKYATASVSITHHDSVIEASLRDYHRQCVEEFLVGDLIGTTVPFVAPGITCIFLWMKEGLIMTISSYNQTQRHAAISAFKGNKILVNSGYAEVIAGILLGGNPKLNEPINLRKLIKNPKQINFNVVR